MSDQWTREGLFELSRGFMKSRVLLTAAELDLFSHLAETAMTAEELCKREGWDLRGLRIVMDALAAQGLLRIEPDGKYGVPDSAARFLTRGAPESLLPLVLHCVRMWRSWSHLTHIVRTGENPNPMGIDARSDDDLESFIGAMHVIGRRLAEEIVADLDLSRFTRLIDVGGGSGVYTMAFLRKAPQLEATLFDMPPVIDMAERFLVEGGFRDRVTLVAGDYHTDVLPGGHDLALLSAIIHSNNREQNERLYRSIHESLVPGGALFVRDHVMDPTRTMPPDGALFAVNMLAATRGGSCYTFDEIKEELEAAGFTDVRMVREGSRMDQVVAAVRPR
jgi:hypothetical protein